MRNKKISGLVLLGIFTTGVVSGNAVDVVSGTENVGNAINNSGKINNTEENFSDNSIDSQSKNSSNNNIDTALDGSKVIRGFKPREAMLQGKKLSAAKTSTVAGAAPTTVVLGKKGKEAKSKENIPSAGGMWISGIGGLASSVVFSFARKRLNRGESGEKSESKSGESYKNQEKTRKKTDLQDDNSTDQEIDVIWPGWRPLAISVSAVLVIVVIIFVVYIITSRKKAESLENDVLALQFSSGTEKNLLDKEKEKKDEDYEKTFI